MNKLLIGIVLGLALSCGSYLAAQAVRWGGSEPYTPTKAEWLCMCINTDDFGFHDEIQIRCVPSPTDKAIVIFASFPETTDRRLVNQRVGLYRDSLTIAAKSKGWDWLVIRELLTSN